MTSFVPIELSLKKFSDKTLEQIAGIQRNAFFGIVESIIYTTPVDTGRARSGWMSDVDQFDTTVPIVQNITGEAAAQIAIDSAHRAIGKHKLGQDLTLSNSVEYIRLLDAGSSLQAPSGMIQDALSQYRQFVEEAAKGGSFGRTSGLAAASGASSFGKAFKSFGLRHAALGSVAKGTHGLRKNIVSKAFRSSEKKQRRSNKPKKGIT